MSCDSPCAFIGEEFKKAGFVCSTFSKPDGTGSENVIKSSFLSNESIKGLDEWLKNVIAIMKLIKCPVRFNYLIKYYRMTDGKTEAKFEIQIIFKNTKDNQFKEFPEKGLKGMFNDYQRLKSFGESLGTVFRLEVSREFVNYVPKAFASEIIETQLTTSKVVV